MKVKRPLLVTFIGDLNILSAIFVIVSFFPTPKFIEQFGFYFLPTQSTFDVIIRILSVISLLVITYEFLRLKKLGYWLMVTYYLFSLAVSIISILSHKGQFASSFIPSLLMLNLIFPSKRYFFERNLTV